ncbi:gliding motility-associated C-terminal domain-containing protein [Daejeonella lutea]|uniref:Gliding motility-associated C-terminal domain-containing protein n=1 Tax=Daejeonella lutea TaxID=572036 RepID=A0A1T5EJH3_9SPHI|nr:gliding motility-associated C-terminal domain-containing protein [Daejeonella lutea]SKB84066.1 gliding motility-associated C-terminal domain-containing protein [Daejeonella lutea]
MLVFFLAPKLAKAQELIEMSIAPGESLSVHSGEGVGIFSSVKNAGSFGSHPNAVVSFFGQRWTNRPSGRIADESINGNSGQGGIFRFRSAANSTQFIESQNLQANAGFTNLTIRNSGNVNLEGSDLHIRGSLNFEAGHLILNNRNAVLSENATIAGFDKDKFVVTGSATNGGFLVKNSTGQQQPDMVFPIGTDPGSYTPASVNYRGVTQDIKVRVFDNVYSKAVLGIPDNVNYVPKTWNVSFSATDPNAVIILNTQHNAGDEGANFASNRLTSFLSRYSTSTELWDNVTPTALGSGTLTSGAAIANAYLHTRTGITGLALNEYFSKSVVKVTAGIAGLRIPAGISPNNDGLNEKFIIENLKPTDKVKLDIYNRWQTLVFRDGNYKNTFDGIGNQKGLVNNELPDGTYYYILNINTEKPITGYIVINR